MNLKQRLEAIKQAAETRIPTEARPIMHRATDDVRRSGIVHRVVRVGQKAPTFDLVNQRDRVNSERLLAEGPLVVSFYRGVW